MTEIVPAMLMVAPNGARRSKIDHPALPITAGELAADAALCREAGAGAIHLHVRGVDGGHILDAERYRDAIAEVNAATGGDLVIQITTEAVGLYQPEQQMALVREVRPEFVSLAIRELVPDPQSEPEAARFFVWMHDEKIVPQFILFDEEDVMALEGLIARGVIPHAAPFVLYVLGRYTKDQVSTPEDLTPYLAAAKNRNWPWMVCAFGPHESACISRALKLGGHGRIGFENNLYLPDGTLAPNNAALVANAAAQAKDHGRETMTPDQLRELMAHLF